MNRLNNLLMTIFVFTLSSGIGTAEIIVQPGGSIQAAANNATSSGELIIVKPRVYSENIIISKPNLVIESDTVTLTAINENGTSSKAMQITVYSPVKN